MDNSNSHPIHSLPQHDDPGSKIATGNASYPHPATPSDIAAGNSTTFTAVPASLNSGLATPLSPFQWTQFDQNVFPSGLANNMPMSGPVQQYDTTSQIPVNWEWSNNMDMANFTPGYNSQGQFGLQVQQGQLSADYGQRLVTSPAVGSGTNNTTSSSSVASFATPTMSSAVISQEPSHSTRASFVTPEGPHTGRRATKKRKVENNQEPADHHNAPPSRQLTERRFSVPEGAAMRKGGSLANTAGLPRSNTFQSTVPSNVNNPSSGSVSPLLARQSPQSLPPHNNESSATLSKPRQSISAPGDISDRKIPEAPHLSSLLPAAKVFPIQAGRQLFKLSGASISSDAPSYFSHFFGEQLLHSAGKAKDVKTLYVDRDPETFKDIALHLQGYHINIRNGEHFVKLYADAQYYSLPRLTQQLFKSDIYIQIGDRHFSIPRDIFSSPGDSPNYFSLGFAHFFATPADTFPGLDRQSLLRPPSIKPPTIPNRSPEVFADLMRLLQGYDVKIRDESHRAELLRDARYFHLKGLEQKLLPHQILHNAQRRQNEIVLRLEDLRQSGVHASREQPTVSQQSSRGSKGNTVEADSTSRGYVCYARPYVDKEPSILVVDISSSEATILHLPSSPLRQLARSSPRAQDKRATGQTSAAGTQPALEAPYISFSGATKTRVAALSQVVAAKLNLPGVTTPASANTTPSNSTSSTPPPITLKGGKVRVEIDKSAWVEVDGGVLVWDDSSSEDEPSSSEAPSSSSGTEDEGEGEGPAARTKAKSKKKDTVDIPKVADGSQGSRPNKTRRKSSDGQFPGLPPVKSWKPPVDRGGDPERQERSERKTHQKLYVRKGQWRIRIVSPSAITDGEQPTAVDGPLKEGEPEESTRQRSSDASSTSGKGKQRAAEDTTTVSAVAVAATMDQVRELEVVLEAVKLEAYTGEWARNGRREFLG